MAGALDVLNVARQQLGFIEGDNNENPYGLWYGIPNESYCAMGVSWCFAQVGLSALVAAQTDKGFSYCPAGLAWFQKKKQIVERNSAQAGDIVFFSWAGNGVADHVELVEGASPLGLTTIGFNTGPDMSVRNQGNGDGCYRRQRNFLHVLAIVRPDYPTVTKPSSSLGTSSKVTAGIAGAGVLGTGGLAATHSSTTTPVPTPSPTVFVAPPFPKSQISYGTQSNAVKAVEMALKKAGLIPNEQGVYNANDEAGVIAWQRKHKALKQTKKLDQATYDSLIASL